MLTIELFNSAGPGLDQIVLAVLAKADALTDAIDGMAEELTGDRQHFHLRGHGR